ncbi:MAG: ArnT family glycosyltransferase, partial [Aggregatilineales bacterium]
FHGDESTQIYMGRDYFHQFIQQDWEQLHYSETPISHTEQHLRLINGTIPKYLFGWAAYSLDYTIDEINEQWDWGADWNYNINTGHIPKPDLLQRSRIISTAFLIISMIAMFYIGYSVQGRGVAYLVSFLYAIHPAILLNGRRAMMEGAFLCCGLLLILAAIWLLRERKWWQYLLVGVFSGLAIASKHTAAMIVVAVFITAILYPIWQIFRAKIQRSSLIRHFIFLAGAGIFALSIFYMLNPGWWDDPVARAGIVLEKRTDLLQIQTDIFDGYTSLNDKVAGWWEQVFIAQPMYYEVSDWQTYIADEIITYEASGVAGIVMGGSMIGASLLLLLTLFGLYRLFRDTAIQNSTCWLVVIWGILTLILTLFITPLEWQRYYLPIYPIVLLLTALSLQHLLNIVYTRISYINS